MFISGGTEIVGSVILSSLFLVVFSFNVDTSFWYIFPAIAMS